MKKLLVIAFDVIVRFWKLLFLFVYLIITYWVLKNRELIFRFLLINDTFPFYIYRKVIVNVILILLWGIFLIGLIIFIRTPIFLNLIMKRRFEKFGFTNRLGEYPKLFPKKKDKYREHGVIYTFNNNGLSILDFEKNVPQLQVALKGQIYELTYGKKNMKKVLVHVIPQKHDTPNIIAPTSDYMTRDMINLLCVGRTGSGKSYGLLVILGSLVKFNENISITICDYKKSSFSQFEDTKNFYGYEDVPSGIKSFYKEFTERLEANDEQRNKQKKVLLIDEYGALIAAQEKKQAEELKTMIANVLFMGRSLGLMVIIGIQRADAEYFKTGARDQFKSILSLGNLSKEQKNMLFSDFKDKMVANNKLGEGYLLENGKEIVRVKIISVRNLYELSDNIKEAMNR